MTMVKRPSRFDWFLVLPIIVTITFLVGEVNGLVPMRPMRPTTLTTTLLRTDTSARSLSFGDYSSSSATPTTTTTTTTASHYRNRHINTLAASASSAIIPAADAAPDNDDDDDAQSDDKKKSSSVSAATFNLIKACVGSGVLALPSGLALMTGLPKATIPASILIIAIGGLSAYTFFILGSLCHERKANTLGDLWKDLVGPSWIVDLTTFLMTLGICLSYSIIIGDFSSALLSVDRRACILGITLTCLYPLARLPSLDALAPVSMVSIIGVLITCAVMVFQWTKRASLLFLTTTTTTTSTAVTVSNNPLTALVLMSMAATSYVCHFSAPALLQSSGNNMADYKRMTIMGFSSVALINVIIMCAGFLTFGTQCAGIILNSYPSSNPWASLCRFLMLISIIGGYPILLGGAKSSLYNLIQSTREKRLRRRQQQPQSTTTSTTTTINEFPSSTMNHMITLALLGSVTMASMVLENAGFVVGFNGATMGSAITYIFPAILAMKANAANRNKSTAVAAVGTTTTTTTTTTTPSKNMMIRLLNPVILGFGITSAIAGGAVSIASAFAPHLLQ